MNNNSYHEKNEKNNLKADRFAKLSEKISNIQVYFNNNSQTQKMIVFLVIQQN